MGSCRVAWNSYGHRNGSLEFNMQDPFDQVGATSSEMSGGLSPAASVSLTLHLKPPIVATPSTLHALKSIGWGMGSGQSRDANTMRGEHARSWRTGSQVGAASEFKPVSSLPPSFGGVTDVCSLLSGAVRVDMLVLLAATLPLSIKHRGN